MNDKASDLTNLSELKFSREQGFFDKNRVVTYLIGAVFVLSFFLLLHFRETHVEVLELNRIAPSYIVAQVDVDYFDEEATIIAKQEAIKDLGKIYEISDKSIADHRIALENFLIYNQDWRKYVEASQFDEVYKGIETLTKALHRLRFTDARTFQYMTDVGMSTNYFLIYTPTDVAEPIHFSNQIWEFLRESALPTGAISPPAADFVISYFQASPWVVEEDVKTQNLLQKKIQGAVTPKYTHLAAGSRVIDQGEQVTAKHIAILQAIKEALSDQRNLYHPLTVLGSILLTLVLTFICVAYFKINHPFLLQSNRRLFLLVTIVILTFAFAKGTEFFLINSHTNLIEKVRYPIFVPLAAILLCSLMNSGVATFVSAFLTVIFTLVLNFDKQGFMLINLSAALVAILSTRSLKRRKEVFIICAKAWACSALIIFALKLYQNVQEPIYSSFIDILVAAIFLIITSVLVVGLLPLFESVFKIMTNLTLTEYMDPNNDLLRRLTIEAPGTYQHSVVVGNLAETAAAAIGANGLFCRVATLYHDVGKIITPQYFTENQQGGINIHQLLTPQESAQVIMAHVREGVALARKAGLPEQFIDIIKEHHGTTLVYYFYHKQLEKMGGDKSLVDEREFRYAGPRPRSKESAIIMIADTLEAASRSLDKLDEKSLNELANRLIRDKAEDGQFDECLLTFEELAIVKNTLIKTIVAFGHTRIKYPKREKPEETVPNPT